MTPRRRIVLAAGGTGGHIFPAQSLAGELTARGHRPVVVTDRRGADYSAAFPHMELHAVRSASPSGTLLAKAKAAVEIGAGTWAARALFRRLTPSVVVGFGGYPSFPAMLAAVRMGCSTLLHEQNAVLGRVNRLLAPRVSALALSFPETKGVRPQDEGKAVVTGNPVREGFAAVRDLKYADPGDGPLRQLVALLGYRDRARRPVQQAHVQSPFQVGHILADYRLAQAQVVRRPGERSRLDHPPKHADTVEDLQLHCSILRNNAFWQ